MEEVKLTELNRNEILKYLGYRGQEYSEIIDEQITRCEKEVLKASEPHLVYQIAEYSDGKVNGVELPGNDIKQMLCECGKVVMMAATLGPQVERLIMKYNVLDMADALIMDACASTAIENVCDNFENELREKYLKEGKYLTDRFSPGYGDMPLDFQMEFCRILNAEKRIGLSVQQNMIMIPRKSVTAIIGISDKKQTLRAKGCEVCNMFKNCNYRKEGVTCNG